MRACLVVQRAQKHTTLERPPSRACTQHIRGMQARASVCTWVQSQRGHENEREEGTMCNCSITLCYPSHPVAPSSSPPHHTRRACTRRIYATRVEAVEDSLQERGATQASTGHVSRGTQLHGRQHLRTAATHRRPSNAGAQRTTSSSGAAGACACSSGPGGARGTR